MKIQAISKQQRNSQTFKALPVGEARQVIQNAFENVLAHGSETDIQEAKIALMQIKNIGKHYNGYNKPLLLTLTEQDGKNFIVAETDNYSKISVETSNLIHNSTDSKKLLINLSFLLNNSLLGQLSKLRDSKHEAAEIMNMLFGKEV